MLVGIFVVVVAAAFPLPVRDTDKAYVLTRDVLRLRAVEPVLLDWRYRPFYDSALIARRNPTWHVQTDVELDWRALEAAGFRRTNPRATADLASGEWYKKGNVLVEVVEGTANSLGRYGLRLRVFHGTLGAQDYRVRIYRCLLGIFAFYSLDWVS